MDEKNAVPTKKRTLRKPVASPAIQPEERQHLIAVAAYYIAERCGFHGSSCHDDWLQAEREIDAMNRPENLLVSRTCAEAGQ